MSSQKTEIKTSICDCLTNNSDIHFDRNGFVRHSGSLQYKRKLGSSFQQIELSVEHGPKDNGDAAAAIYPWLTVKIPDIDSLAIEMTGSDDRLLSVSAPTLHQPIELLSPRGHGSRWYVYQPQSVEEAIRSFVNFCNQWVFQFLDAYFDAESVVSMYESNDERVLNVQDQSLRVVAALLLLERSRDARTLLEDKFGRPANRRRFSCVFDFVQRRIASEP